ncbi:hypothetical protein JT359_14450 [Candidatus Poribacteria bacterium]|nr:hypothetical protein [Candidatus Poribacteria bacterium]
MENKTVYFAGSSGQFYPFAYYSIHSDLPDNEAIYILTKENNGSYKAQFIGQTDTLASCIQYHELWVRVSRRHVDSVCVYSESDPATRKRIEQDLLERQKPPCNNILD